MSVVVTWLKLIFELLPVSDATVLLFNSSKRFSCSNVIAKVISYLGARRTKAFFVSS